MFLLLEPLSPANRFGSHHPHNHSLHSAPKAPAQGPKLEVYGLGSHFPLLADLTLAAPSALPTPHSLDLWFDDCLAKITHLITSKTPTKRLSF